MKPREQSFSEYLDKEMNNKLFVKFVFSDDFKEVEAFAVSQISIIGEKPVEIIRFDATAKEKTNVHKFYLKPPEKQYLNKEKNFETLEEFMKRIKNNWRMYRSRYEENYI